MDSDHEPRVALARPSLQELEAVIENRNVNRNFWAALQ